MPGLPSFPKPIQFAGGGVVPKPHQSTSRAPWHNVRPVLQRGIGLWAWPCRILLPPRSEEHTSELQSLMRISYAVFCLNKNIRTSFFCFTRIFIIHFTVPYTTLI